MSVDRSSWLLDRICRYVVDNLDRFLGELSEFCRFASVSAEGKELEPTAQWLVRKLEDLGAETKLIETADGVPLVYGVIEGERQNAFLFYNFYDVVSEGPRNLWESDPFSPVVRNGRFYARGANSNKGNLLARIHAVEALVRGAQTQPPVTVKFLLDGGEEIGSPYLPDVFRRCREILAADGCLWAEGYKDPMGRPQISLGTKGFLFMELRAEAKRPELHSSYATLVPNPAWQLVEALNTLSDALLRCKVEGFYDQARGPSAEESQLLSRLDFGEEQRKAEWGLDSFLGGESGAKVWLTHLYKPTCTICGLSAGYLGPGIKAVLPSEAAAKIEFRLVPDQRAHDVEKLVRRHLEIKGFASLQCDVLAAMDPSRTPLDAPLVGAACRAAQDVFGEEPAVMPLSPISGFAGLVNTYLGAPTIAAGVGDARSNPHGPNESIAVSSYQDGIRFGAALLARFAEVLE
jgi:acetylornithine deacetylase/succinyl-diaminopimelate desuccinylase-like protein